MSITSSRYNLFTCCVGLNVNITNVATYVVLLIIINVVCFNCSDLTLCGYLYQQIIPYVVFVKQLHSQS